MLLHKCYFDYKDLIKTIMNFATYYVVFHDPFWTLLLSAALFYPVRQLIWILYVRKKQKIQQSVSEDEKKILKKRATFTSVFLSIVFSYIYVTQAFN
tara:strand:+ start:366 stop:656 length:291 start_codon:yes stop_codon:yes gene_type:complete